MTPSPAIVALALPSSDRTQTKWLLTLVVGLSLGIIGLRRFNLRDVEFGRYRRICGRHRGHGHRWRDRGLVHRWLGHGRQREWRDRERRDRERRDRERRDCERWDRERWDRERRNRERRDRERRDRGWRSCG